MFVLVGRHESIVCYPMLLQSNLTTNLPRWEPFLQIPTRLRHSSYAIATISFVLTMNASFFTCYNVCNTLPLLTSKRKGAIVYTSTLCLFQDHGLKNKCFVDGIWYQVPGTGNTGWSNNTCCRPNIMMAYRYSCDKSTGMVPVTVYQVSGHAAVLYDV